jgi:hypothetical protein
MMALISAIHTRNVIGFGGLLLEALVRSAAAFAVMFMADQWTTLRSVRRRVGRAQRIRTDRGVRDSQQGVERRLAETGDGNAVAVDGRPPLEPA